MRKARAASGNRPIGLGGAGLASGRGGRRCGFWLGVAGMLAGGMAALLPPPAAEAQEPVMIHVRGRTQLRLREGARVRSSGANYQLTVAVELDDGQERGRAESDPPAGPTEPGSADADPRRSFAGQSVRLRLRTPDDELTQQTATTGRDGSAMVSLGELPAGSYTVVADYIGDELRDPAHAELQVDLGRQPVLLTLGAPSQAPRNGELALQLTLISEGAGLSDTVTVSLDSVRRPVRLVRGFAQTTVPLRGLPALRKGQVLSVLASYPGDQLHTSALQRRTVLLTSQARVTLELGSAPGIRSAATGEIAQGSALIAVGTVTDEDGPLPSEPVDLEITEQPGGERLGESAASSAAPPARGADEPQRLLRALASGVTDRGGRFRIVIPHLHLHPGPAVLAAQVTPRYRYILPARAPELPITVLPPEPVSAFYYLLPLGATVLGALLWLAGRWLRPQVLKLLAAWQKGRSPEAPPPPGAASSQSVPALSAAEASLGEPGVSLAQSRRLTGLTLRRTVDTTLEGQVLDASFGRPVGGAVLTVQPTAALAPGASEPQLARTVHATEEGRFAVSQLAAGRYLVEVTAPGYLPQRFPAAVPHRGELRGISVRLEPIRVRLLGEWRRVAQSLLDQESRLRTATPRELLEQAARLRGAAALAYGAAGDALARLTDLVEQAYYSPRVCTPQMLAEAEQLAIVLLQAGASPGSLRPAAPLPAAGPPVPLS